MEEIIVLSLPSLPQFTKMICGGDGGTNPGIRSLEGELKSRSCSAEEGSHLKKAIITAFCHLYGCWPPVSRDNAILSVTSPPWALMFFICNTRGEHEIPGSQLLLQPESHEEL